MTNNFVTTRIFAGFALAALLTTFSLSARTATATPIVGYSLQVSEGVVPSGGPLLASAQLLAARDTPLFTFVNTSSEASITNFAITIGDLSYNFDAVTFNALATGPQVTSFAPDGGQGGAHANAATLNFANFTPSSAFQFRTDIDPDNGNFLANFRQVFGSSTPAQVTVKFSDGSVLTNIMSAVGLSYQCAGQLALPQVSQQQNALVPEPDGLTLAMLGAVALGLLAGWRRRSARHRLAKC